MIGVHSATVIVPRSGISTTRSNSARPGRQGVGQRPPGARDLPHRDLDGRRRIAAGVVTDLLAEEERQLGIVGSRCRSPSQISLQTLMCETTWATVHPPSRWARCRSPSPMRSMTRLQSAQCVVGLLRGVRRGHSGVRAHASPRSPASPLRPRIVPVGPATPSTPDAARTAMHQVAGMKNVNIRSASMRAYTGPESRNFSHSAP